MKSIPLEFSDIDFGTAEYGYIPIIANEDPDDADTRYTRYLRSQGIQGRVDRMGNVIIESSTRAAMKITEAQLRRIIRSEILHEEAPAKVGSEAPEAEGTLNVKKIADTLGLDASKLSAAVKAAKAGKRNASHNAILGDVFVKLMDASPNDTVKAMGAFKAVTDKPEEEEK